MAQPAENKLKKIFDQNVEITGTLTVGGSAVSTTVVDKSYIDALNVDADTLDGLNSTQFLRSDTSATMSGSLTIDTGGDSSNALVIRGESPTISFIDQGTSDDFYIHVNSNNFYVLRDTAGADIVGTGWDSPYPLQLEGDTNIGYLFGNKIWSDGNDGSGSGLDADLLDGQQGSYYAIYSHIRSLGTQAFTGTATTAGLISEMESDGAFDSYTSVFKTSWSYAGNFDLSDAGRFTETAGSSWITWTDDSSESTRGNITALAIAPNTGGSAGKVFIYNDQGSGYAPGWREVWTSTSDGAGSGLDADLWDGNQFASYLNQAVLSTSSPTFNNLTVATLNTGQGANELYAMNQNVRTTDSVTFANISGTLSGTAANANHLNTTRDTPSDSLQYWQASGLGITEAPSSDWHNTIRMGHGSPLSYYSNTLAVRMTGTGVGDIYTQTIVNGSPQGWKKHWNDGNDGAGSGLDADLLDGVQASQFLRSDTTDTAAGNLTFTGIASFTNASNEYSGHLYYNPHDANGNHYPHFRDGSNANGVNINWRLYSGASLITHTWNYTDTNFVNSLRSTVDMRAPLFYDSNNTGYYINPASTSVLSEIDILSIQRWFRTGGLAHQRADARLDGSDQARLHWYGKNDSNGTVNFKHAWYDGSSYVNVTAASGTLSFDRVTDTISISSDGDFRAPIFYDSNNTGYYTNPASTSNLNQLDVVTLNASNRITPDLPSDYGQTVLTSLTSAPIHYNDVNVGTVDTYLPLSHASARYTSGYRTHMNIGLYKKAAAWGESQTGMYVALGGNDSYPTMEWRLTYGPVLYNSWGYVENSGSFRAPIFYDSNNTAYYLNPASGSYLNYLGVGAAPNTSGGYVINMGGSIHMNNNSIDYITQLHFNDNVRFYDDGNDSYLNFKYGDAVAGGIRFRNGGDTQKGYVYADNGGFGLLDSDGSWAVRTQTGTNPLSLYCDNNEEFQVHTSYTLSLGSSRAPLFYDSDNTGYYIDGSSTSRLNILNVNAVGTSVAGIGKVLFPHGAEYNDNGTVTGAFKITLPQTWTNTMMSMKIVVFDYAVNESFEISCGGYTYAGDGGRWVNTHAKIIASGKEDRNFNIRFGHDGTKCCIYIGETTSNWAYPKVVVTEWIGGHSNEAFDKWDNGWDISAVTSLGTITSTETNSQIGRYQSIIYDVNDTGYYVDPASTSVMNNARFAGGISVNAGGSSTTKHGVSLYSTTVSGKPPYGILFTGTVGEGTHGSVTSDWATYFTMAGSTARGWIFQHSSTGNVASISGTGNASFNGDVIAYFSDMRLKTKLGNIENPIQKIQSLNGFYYEPNEVAESYGYKKERKLGLSAQEVEAILPEIVTDAPIGDGYKTVDYAKLVPVLIEAIKEQQKQIDELKQLINK